MTIERHEQEMTKARRNPRTAWRRVEDEVLIISSDTNSLTVLNDTAARVWELLEGDRTSDDLAQALSSEYEVEPIRAERDVEALLRDLKRRGLVLLDEGGT